ncbi:hypothetical protein DCCM_4717 [Desulfocucumis palustris]|uniref:Orotate phosphoribosyltransferase n=1 Tax=Desulfocucumis palustris TaxID=1898651 RepID=A0A2L2XH78_9FIRM|nr:hypothetical protein DCCM_4717 [Desulfocucumis palustris]
MLTYASQEKNWAIFCHLGGFAGYIIPFGNIIVPLVLWLIKRDESPFVNQHGKEALNFNISFIIYAFISGLLCLILIGFALLAVLVILQIVFIINASMCASRGEYYHYPLTIRLIS